MPPVSEFHLDPQASGSSAAEYNGKYAKQQGKKKGRSSCDGSGQSGGFELVAPRNRARRSATFALTFCAGLVPWAFPLQDLPQRHFAMPNIQIVVAQHNTRFVKESTKTSKQIIRETINATRLTPPNNCLAVRDRHRLRGRNHPARPAHPEN